MATILLVGDDAPQPGADEPGTRPSRARADLAFGLWVFIASEAMFFGALFLAYAWGRYAHAAGFAAASRATDIVLGSVNTLLLLTSSGCVAAAVVCARGRRSRPVAGWLVAAACLGTIFLVVKAVEWRHDVVTGLLPGAGFHLPAMAQNATPAGSEMFFAFYFASTGLHGLHVLIGIVLLATAAAGARRAPRRWCASGRVEAIGLYWHFVDVVWVVLWPLLYLGGRS